jgi:hypothetical protein
MLRRTRVIDTNLLARSQRRCDSVASGVNDVRSRTESETYGALLAPDDNRLSGLIGSDRARFVSCARSRCGRRSCRRCAFFGRGRAGLCKRQWRNQPADQSNNCSLHSNASFLIGLPPQFVTQRSGGRSFRVISSAAWYCDASSNCDFSDLSGRREFGNMGR